VFPRFDVNRSPPRLAWLPTFERLLKNRDRPRRYTLAGRRLGFLAVRGRFFAAAFFAPGFRAPVSGAHMQPGSTSWA
jgi:hypothetical protein